MVLDGVENGGISPVDNGDACRVRGFPAVVAACALLGCAAPERPRRHPDPAVASIEQLSVYRYDGAAGFGWLVSVSPRRFAVTQKNDFGLPDEVLLERALTAADWERLRPALSGAELKGLREEYANPWIFDGLQLFFEFQFRDGTRKEVVVRNKYVPELAGVLSALDRHLPEEHRFQYREWAARRAQRDRESESFTPQEPPIPYR